MQHPLTLTLASFLLLAAPWSGSGGRGHAAATRARPLAFEELGLHIEVDLPSGTAFRDAGGLLPPHVLRGLASELVLSVRAPLGLSSLQVLDAQAHALFEVALSERPGCGVSELELESEGSSLAELLDEYPTGPYVVRATAVTGEVFEGVALLSARLPGSFEVTSPAPDAVVPPGDVTISWTPAPGAVHYVLEVEQEHTGFVLETRLAAGTTSVSVPAQWLEAGQPYDYSLLVQGDTDNELELEGRFYTP